VKPVNGKLDVAASASPWKKQGFARLWEKSTCARQITSPDTMVVSVVSKDAKYKVDGTNMGFKPVKKFTAEEASTPRRPIATCNGRIEQQNIIDCGLDLRSAAST